MELIPQFKYTTDNVNNENDNGTTADQQNFYPVVPDPSLRRKSTSQIWLYFEKCKENSNFAICKTCHKVIGRPAGNTTNLWSHIRKCYNREGLTAEQADNTPPPPPASGSPPAKTAKICKYVSVSELSVSPTPASPTATTSSTIIKIDPACTSLAPSFSEPPPSFTEKPTNYQVMIPTSGSMSRRKSKIWKYFDKLTSEPDVAQCKACLKHIRRSTGNTTNLWKHAKSCPYSNTEEIDMDYPVPQSPAIRLDRFEQSNNSFHANGFSHDPNTIINYPMNEHQLPSFVQLKKPRRSSSISTNGDVSNQILQFTTHQPVQSNLHQPTSLDVSGIATPTSSIEMECQKLLKMNQMTTNFALMMVQDLIPLGVVHKTGFNRLIAGLNPEYKTTDDEIVLGKLGRISSQVEKRFMDLTSESQMPMTLSITVRRLKKTGPPCLLAQLHFIDGETTCRRKVTVAFRLGSYNMNTGEHADKFLAEKVLLEEHRESLIESVKTWLDIDSKKTTSLLITDESGNVIPSPSKPSSNLGRQLFACVLSWPSDQPEESGLGATEDSHLDVDGRNFCCFEASFSSFINAEILSAMANYEVYEAVISAQEAVEIFIQNKVEAIDIVKALKNEGFVAGINSLQPLILNDWAALLSSLRTLVNVKTTMQSLCDTDISGSSSFQAITLQHWDILAHFVRILSVFDSGIKKLSQAEACIGQVLPVVMGIRSAIE